MTRTIKRAGLALALALLGSTAAPLRAASATVPNKAKTETVIFAGGCFWGIQSVFQHTKGVVSATSGYAGGNVDRPGYEQVGSGRTGHAESVKVVFDPAQISYMQLMRIFFSPFIHDPTELNRQGPDVGTQYRSAVFASTEEQKKATDAYIDQLNKSHVYPRPIVTQVSVNTRFWPAEAYHQNYAELHPDNPYIAINDAPKVVSLKKAFPELYSDKLAAHE